MALLDVSDIIWDPDFADDLIITRFARTVSTLGRTQDAPGLFFTFGNVQPAKDEELLQIPELERAGSFILVVTQFRLIPLTATTAPDLVQWNNKQYRVLRVADYKQYGNGFVSAVCQLTDVIIDGPP